MSQRMQIYQKHKRDECSHDWTGREATMQSDVFLHPVTIKRKTPVCTKCGLSKAYLEFMEKYDG